MRISILSFITFFISQLSFAQIIQSSSDTLVFGNTNVGSKDSVQISLTNRYFQTVQVNNVKFYTIYGDFPFSASQTNFSIPANGSINIWVYFEPEHNILHNSEMVVFHNANSGVTSIDLRGQGVFPNPYYNTTQNLEEQALKNALKTRLGQGYVSLSYNAARDNMYASIDNNNGQVECAYTGRTATFNSRAGANNNSFNCEHTFPQGFFSQNLPMRSDIHHLFSTDVNANSQRGSLPFGIVSGSGTWSQGGSKKGNGVFEPRNQQKGRTARAMMYFVIRYQDYSNHFSPQENLLLNWHNAYPPLAAEKQRNDDIYALQNNRNPFVDYPQLAERISNFVGNSTAPTVNGIDITQTAIDFGMFLSQQADTFNYVIVNRGNTNITFSNFSLSNNTDLRFAGGFGGSIQILAGDALVIPVIAQTSTTITLNENLSFNTSLPGSQSSFTIPIRGTSIVVSVNDNSKQNDLVLYPNPVEELLNINHLPKGSNHIRIFDLNGKLVLESSTSQGNAQVDVSNLPIGSYLLELNGEKREIFQKK